MNATEVDLAFLIADLSGYTALTEAHGNAHAASVVTRYADIAESLLGLGERLLERVGDELLIAAEDVVAVVRTAIALRAAVEREPLFPTIRSGIHAGAVVAQGDRYIGSALNLTARVAAHARGGQILCTDRVAALSGGLDDVSFRPMGPVRFKNIAAPVEIFEVVARLQLPDDLAIDPVCRMRVGMENAPARLMFGGRVYYFCSFECARTFTERPGDYI